MICYSVGNASEYAHHTCRSDSPMYMLMSSGPLTLRKLMLHSVATALATKVLPVPTADHSVVLYWQALLHTPNSHVLAVHGSQACQNVRRKCQQTAQHATSRSIAKSKCRSHKGSYSSTVDLCCMSLPNFTAHRIHCKHHLVPICKILLHDNS